MNHIFSHKKVLSMKLNVPGFLSYYPSFSSGRMTYIVPEAIKLLPLSFVVFSLRSLTENFPYLSGIICYVMALTSTKKKSSAYHNDNIPFLGESDYKIYTAPYILEINCRVSSPFFLGIVRINLEILITFVSNFFF